MKVKYLLLFGILPILLFGQVNNFEYHQFDLNTVGSADSWLLIGEIVNVSEDSLTLTANRVTHAQPASWTCSMCLDFCLPPFFDDYTYGIQTGDTSHFDLTIFTGTELGFGAWTIYMVDSTTMETDSAHITLEVVAVGIDEITTPDAFAISKVYPNPTNAWFQFDLLAVENGVQHVTLFDVNGRPVLERDYRVRAGHNTLAMQVHGIPTGTYILQSSYRGSTSIQKVNLIK